MMNSAKLEGRSRVRLAAVGAATMALALAGCGAMPIAGPTTAAITRQGHENAPPFLLVPLDRTVMTALAAATPEDFTPLAAPAPAPQSTIHVGDTVSVTLWEFGSGLLGPTATYGGAPGLVGAQSATIPSQTVDQAGNIIVPFAGDIAAAGRTPRQVQAAIIAALRGKASEAQALVQIVNTNENAVTVTGDVNHPGRFPLITSGTRLLDAISEAGGATGKARDTLVQLSRGGVVRTLLLSTVLGDPTQNVFLRSNDLVTLDQEPQTVTVLGATNKNAEVPFGKTHFTLAEAIGNGGGLNDQLADPFGVYVLRFERTVVAQHLRTEPLPDYMTWGDKVPVIYQINLKTPEGLLMAQNFRMHDQDVVYVANTATVQLGKLARLLDVASSIAKSGSNTSYSY